MNSPHQEAFRMPVLDPQVLFGIPDRVENGEVDTTIRPSEVARIVSALLAQEEAALHQETGRPGSDESLQRTVER